MNRNHIQAEEEIFSEGARAERRLQIAICSGNDADLYAYIFIAPYGPHLSLLQNTQQFGLQFKRQFTDFVEENRPSVRGLKQAGLGFYGSREGAFRVTEQIAFHQGRNQRAAIDGHKRPLRKRAPVMDGARYQFLPRSALATNQHRGPRVFQPADDAQDFTDLGGLADDSVQLLIGFDPFTKNFVLLHEPDFFLHPAKQHSEFFHTERLLDVVVRARLHRFDGRLDGPMPSHDNDFGGGRRDLIWRSKSAPDRLGNRRSAMTMSGVTAGLRANAASALSASEQRYPRG